MRFMQHHVCGSHDAQTEGSEETEETLRKTLYECSQTLDHSP